MNCIAIQRKLIAAGVLLCLSTFPARGSQQINIALGKPVLASGQTSPGQPATNITDGNYQTYSLPLGGSSTFGFYYRIDLGQEYSLGRIIVFNRSGCCPERLSNYVVIVARDDNGQPGQTLWSASVRPDGSNSGDGGCDVLTAGMNPNGTFFGRFIFIYNMSQVPFSPQIAEVEVYQMLVPIVSSFIVDPDYIGITHPGNLSLPDSATLSWRVFDYTTITIDHGIGNVTGPAGSISVAPSATTTYTLTATNQSGSSTASATVYVDEQILNPLITEFMADNVLTLQDDEGEYSDWIEVYNPNPFGMNLAGYYLTDDPAEPAKWSFPAVLVPAGGYIVVFASNKDQTDPSGQLHTNFQLSKNGEYLALVARDGVTVIQQFPVNYPFTKVYPKQKEDISYGLDGSGIAGFFLGPTPGQPNGQRIDGFVEDTKFLPDRGFYDAPINVNITTATQGAVIRYTTDGSEPNETNGTVYSGPIPVTTTTVLRAAAFKSGLVPTNSDTHIYIFLDSVIASSVMNKSITQDPTYAPQMRDALTDLPTISIATRPGVLEPYLRGPGPYPAGTYDEVTASVEYIMPDGSDGFQENAGVSRFGGHWYDKPGSTRPFDKWSFRIYFRREYGVAKLKFPLFTGFDRGIRPVEVFDQLDLHAGHHDMSQRGFYMSSRLTEDTMLDMGDLNPHGRSVHLYINGVYWGLYHLHERWNADMNAQYLGGDKEDYESIKTHVNQGGWGDMGVPYDGDGSAWQRVLSLKNNYEALKPYFDFQSYIDFMLMYMFGNSEPEYRCVGPIEQGSGFKFWLNDADGFTRSASNRASGASGPGGIFIALFNQGNPDYKTLLADRIHENFFNDGAMTPAMMTARLLERCNEIQRAFIAEAARWGYRTPSSWASARDSYIKTVLLSRTTIAVNEFRGAGFYPATDAPEFNQHGGNVPSGFQLTMTAPANTVVYYTVDGSDPRLPGGAISPTAQLFAPSPSVSPVTVTLLGADSGVSAYVPTDETLGITWTAAAFDDAGWLHSNQGEGVGYDNDTTYLPYIDLSVDSQMNGINTTVYIRYIFQVSDPSKLTGLELRMRYDDGYVAYLNGEVIASRNAPAVLSWNSGATAGNSDSSAVVFETASITHPSPLGLLRTDANMLAIHGLNVSLTSTDMLIEPELNATIDASPPPPGDSDNLVLNDARLIKARTLKGSEWSGLTEAFFTVDGRAAVLPGDMVITELNYNPLGSDNTEFMELMNVSTHAVNLRGVKFTMGIDFTFPDNRDTALAPGQRIILVKSLFDFQKQYGIDIPVAGIYSGSLNNDGESVVMTGPDSTQLLLMTYNDAAPWPKSADGQGDSLVLINPHYGINLDDPSNWRASTTAGGTPGIGE